MPVPKDLSHVVRIIEAIQKLKLSEIGYIIEALEDYLNDYNPKRKRSSQDTN